MCKFSVGLTIQNRESHYPKQVSIIFSFKKSFTILQYRKMWQISRCDFNGRDLTVVYAGIQEKPNHFEVDPFNG